MKFGDGVITTTQLQCYMTYATQQSRAHSWCSRYYRAYCNISSYLSRYAGILSLPFVCLFVRLSVCLSVLDASPSKLLNRFGWNFSHEWRSILETACGILMAIARGRTPEELKMYRW